MDGLEAPALPERIATILRANWVIENRLRFVGDTAFREDASKIRTGYGPENMATLRSFAINQLRTTDHTHIAAGLRTTALRPYERPAGHPWTQLTCADARSADFAITLGSRSRS